MPSSIPSSFRTLDLNLLRVFDEVMAERSLTRAAHNLSLTQPAVSNALRRLREALGDELVRRHGHGMQPTPRALALWPSVRVALRQLQAAIVPSAFEPQQANSTFVLAMADATAAELMGGLARQMELQAPAKSKKASTKIDFPAPVSPVNALNPFANSQVNSSTTAKFRIRNRLNMTQ